MKAVLFGYHEMACTGLKALMDAGFTVSALFTHADPASGAQFYGSVARLAERYNIPVFITEDVNTAEWQTRIASLEADYLFCFSYRQVLSEAILSSVKKGAYNVHAALLPAYRGRAHLNWVIIKGETQTGVTLHRMIKRPDAGPILAQKAVEIHPQDNALALHTRLVATTAQMLPAWLDALVAGELTETPQDERAASCLAAVSRKMAKFTGRRPPAISIILFGRWRFPGPALLHWQTHSDLPSGKPALLMPVKPASRVKLFQFHRWSLAVGRGNLKFCRGSLLAANLSRARRWQGSSG